KVDWLPLKSGETAVSVARALSGEVVALIAEPGGAEEIALYRADRTPAGRFAPVEPLREIAWLGGTVYGTAADATGVRGILFDVASRGLEEEPEAGASADGLALRHRAVLALARSGATRRARALFGSLGLDGNPDPEIAALDARLAKDEALAATGDDRARLARI